MSDMDPDPNPYVVLRAWSHDLATRRSEDTHRTYTGVVHRALADICVDPRALTASDVTDYIATKRTQHGTQIYSALADCTAFMHRRGHRLDDPLAQVDRPRAGARRLLRRALTRDELHALVLSALVGGPERARWANERLAWTIAAHYHSGLRPGEMLNMTTDRVRLDDEGGPALQVFATKTQLERYVPLSAPGAACWAELCRGRVGVVVGIGGQHYSDIVRRASLAVGIAPLKARPYTLRHTFATHLAGRGVAQNVIAELLGHVDTRHTRVYTVPFESETRNAVNLLTA